MLSPFFEVCDLELLHPGMLGDGFWDFLYFGYSDVRLIEVASIANCQTASKACRGNLSFRTAGTVTPTVNLSSVEIRVFFHQAGSLWELILQVVI
jgi:hypothetical protein